MSREETNRNLEAERLVEDHLHVVHAIARGWRARCRSTIEHADLVQVGTIGLIEAARRFDPTAGFPFAAFAADRVRGAICDFLRSRDPLTRRRRRAVRQLDEARQSLGSSLGREPQRHELAARLGWASQDLERVLGDAAALTQGWATVRTDETVEATAFAAPDPAPTAFDELAGAELREQLAEAIAELPERERLVISLYYDEEEAPTMAQIGAALGVTESRVSQLHSQAVKRLRTTLAERAAEPMQSMVG